MGSNLDIIKGVYSAFGVGDVAAVLGAMDDQIEWREPASLAPTFTDQVGPDAIAQNVFGSIMSLVTDFAVTPEEFVDGGDVIISLGRYSGVGASSGVKLDCPFAHVWRVRDGKITYFQTITDTVNWRAALGM